MYNKIWRKIHIQSSTQNNGMSQFSSSNINFQFYDSLV